MCDQLVVAVDENCYWTHRKANQSITSLDLFDNKIGNQGAIALAEALKATLLKRFWNTRARHTFINEERCSENATLEAFDCVVEQRACSARVVGCNALESLKTTRTLCAHVSKVRYSIICWHQQHQPWSTTCLMHSARHATEQLQ